MAHQFGGTGVALVTPFRANGSTDYDALEKMTGHVIDGGVDYIVALGTTAETPTLSEQEKKDVLSSILKTTAGRVPVVCGIGGNNTAEVLHSLGSWDLEGVAGILSVSPYYNRPSQEGIYRHFAAIADATDKPVILYNVPPRTGGNILPETALRLAREYNNITAVKEASGSMTQCMDLIREKPAHFAVLSGDDELALPQIALGMEGVISVAANCFPHDFTQMIRDALAHRIPQAAERHYRLLTGIRLLFAEGNPAGVKSALKTLGLTGAAVRLPLVEASAALEQQIAAYLKATGLTK